MPTKAELQDKSLDELKSIAASLRTKRQPAEGDEDQPVEKASDLRSELAKLPVDQLAAVRDQLKAHAATDDSPAVEGGNRYEGMIRSLVRQQTLGLSEPVVSGVKAAAETIKDSSPLGENMGKMVRRLGKNYDQERDLGNAYSKKYNADDLTETAGRSALETASFGVSEPVVSGYNAAVKTALEPLTGNGSFSDALDRLKQNYSQDVRGREKMKDNFRDVDIASQVAGAFFQPSGMLRKGAAGALERYAPELTEKTAAAVTKYFEENPNIWKTMLRETGKVIGGGAKAAADVGEAQAIRNEALSRTGFEDPDQQENPIAAATGAFKFGAGVAAVPPAMKVLGKAGKLGIHTFLGPDEQSIDYYLANIERLRNENPTVAKLADEVNGAVDKIKTDFQNKVTTRDKAQEAVDQLQTLLEQNHYLEHKAIRNELEQAKKELALAFGEEKAGLDSFKRSLPQRHFEEVSDSVEQVRNQARQSKQIALGVLAQSKEKIPLGKTVVELEDGTQQELPGIMDQLKAIRSSYNIKGNDTALGQQARAAQARIDDYMAQIQKMGPNVSASKLRGMVDQLDDDIQAIGSITGIASKPDATLMALRANLDQRLAVVPGWSEAIGMARDSAQALGRVSQHIKQPGDIVSFLRNVGDDHNFLHRDVLHELGQRTGKDFTGITDDAQQALAISRSPRAMDEIKQGLPEAQRVRDVQTRLDDVKDPYKTADRMQAEMQNSDKWLKLQQAEKEVNDAQHAADMFKNWNTLNIDNKLKTMMNGKEALKAQLGVLGQMSDKDFVQSLDDLRTMLQFNGTYKIGSRNVNLWGTIGAASSTGNPEARRIMLGVVGGALADNYGPRMARQVLNLVADIKGVVTIDKIEELDLPDFVKNDLANQFAKAVYYGANSPKPNVTLDPQSAVLVRQEIQRSKSLSNIEKARQLSNLNKYGQVDTTKVLLGGREQAPLVGPDQEPNQLDAVDPEEQLMHQPPTVPEIMSRLKGK
jgi:hypothetical protein